MNLSVSIVALPLGNVGDLTSRAVQSLESADRIFCEDTRKTKDLLARAKIASKARLTPLPGDSEHNFDWSRCLEESTQGADECHWVLVSDAGTPIVNDPGAGLIAFCRQNDIPVRALPGPSAPILAWQWSGGFGLPFSFVGFAPKSKNPGSKDLGEFFAPLSHSGTFVFFDTKHQFDVTLRHLIEAGFGAKKVFVAREMTKTHEELISGSVAEVLEILQNRLATEGALGELTLVLEGSVADRTTAGGASLDELISVRSAPTKEAAKVASRLTGLSSKECYDAFVKNKGSAEK